MSMERISRALELAARQREAHAAAAIAEQPQTENMPETAAVAPIRAPQAPVLTLDPAAMEREYVLPPSAGGARGRHYKLLRTQVLRRLDQLKANTLAVLSPKTDAGKTLTAINLAIAIAAELDRTALLVDLDLRNPGVHQRLGLRPELGIEDCLQAGRPVSDAIVRLAGYERLTVLPVREPVEHSAELLNSEYAIRQVADLRNRYANRIIVVDLPPVLQADDALAFSRTAQAGLMVVGEGRTARADLLQSMELLRDLTIVGTVLNGSREPVVQAY
ncbi:MAG: CpsD/CapB family tyrosine-protein kinase [Nevskiaceae bacterium]|jgi:Mrp family chromosome partitioning ATPase|nr:CpsD/CapB family tyrosine-protein kinase [Nevskiaceae bacterium]